MGLKYPQDLHDLHNDYPSDPERVTVQEDMLASHAKTSLGNANFTTVPKLVLNLHDKKKNYAVHYRNLKLYIKLGFKFKF